MMHKNWGIKALFALVTSVFFLTACEPEADNLGDTFFDNSAVQGNEQLSDIITYNISNGDVVNTANIKGDSATVGVFHNDIFGMQRSSYVTQVRLFEYEPKLGTAPVMDSAVLSVELPYQTSGKVETVKDDYIYPEGSIAAKKIVTTYPVKYYGNEITDANPMNFEVREVTEFMGASGDEILSSKIPATGALIGSGVFKGKVHSLSITKDADNSNILNYNPSFRIKLDNAFLQNKILNAPASQLTDAATFIRYFRGIQVSVKDNNGAILKFKPENMSVKMYYHYTTTNNGVNSQLPQTLFLDLGNAYNVMYNSIQYSRPSNFLVSTGNTSQGDDKIYMQGMGGPGMGVKIPQQEIEKIKNLVKQQNIAIIGAKLRFYSDENIWDNPYAKPNSLIVREEGSWAYMQDPLFLIANPNFAFVKVSDLAKNPTMYEISITQTLKNIVEKEQPVKDFIVNVGNYKYTSGRLLGINAAGTEVANAQKLNTNHYTPNQVVLVGSGSANPKRAQLVLIYGKK